MTGFAIGATLLVGAALLFLLLPFRRRPTGTDFSRKQLNAAIYRDELDELESDRAEGSLAQADYEQARAELQRRLLEDSQDEGGAQSAAPAGRTLPIVLALALPIGAVILYLALGNPAALNPPPPAQQFTADDIERMVAGLAAKLEKEPENFQGWAMLARSYKAMGRFPEALRAYERSGALLDQNADLLLDYADTMVMNAGGFDAKVIALIDKAIKLEPRHPQALWMRGTAAYGAQDYARALSDWEALLAQLPPESENARMLEANIAEVKDLQAKAGRKK